MNNPDKKSKDELLLPVNMLKLYTIGAFPMADEDTDDINWYMPEIRTIIPLDEFNIPRSLRKFYLSSGFEYRFDYDFPAVVKGCASREKTWISEKLIAAYMNLWQLGYIHTVEVYKENELVGGLYGVAYKGAFFGESMFSVVSQASKCALIKLVEKLKREDYSLLDVQF
ncbi:MAG TPA: leucyl/phenylalanyl-tRNA--protein transferase, partial [Ignavibacteriaceae bacterium]|nr:leucyl/phenylalanyl-tRNA--protein transferase [Ignavibacteriaceae bacterium]